MIVLTRLPGVARGRLEAAAPVLEDDLSASDSLKQNVKELLVRQLKLQMKVEEIADDAPLFGEEGLGLDSIDVLEVVASVEKEYGISIKSQEEGERVLQNVGTLAEFIVSSGYQEA